MTTAQQKRRVVYGRRLSRPLRKEQTSAVKALLPKLQVSLPDEAIDPASLFSKKYEQLWLEIGFGSGEHLNALMQKYPSHAFIGAEPFVNGMANFLKSIKDTPHDNVRVWMDDALMLLPSFTEQSVNGIYVLNPDPWPKTRHHKRRIINQENLDVFAHILKPGAPLIMTTDVDDLADWMVTQASQHPAFEWTANKADDWRTPPPGWIETRYEQKGRQAGRKQTYLIFKRK